MRRTWGAVEGLPVVTVGAVLASVAVVAVIALSIPLALILDVTVPIAVRAARTIAGVAAVAVIIAVTVTTVVLTRRVIATARARRAATRGAAAAVATITVTIGAVETPRRTGRCASPLDLQDVVAANALVVHVVVGLVGIATILVLNERKESARCGARGRDVAAD